jgi:hypothetical protein
MRSSSSWTAKTRANTLANGAKVQSSNNTVNVNLGIVCKAVDYSQLVFTTPRCQNCTDRRMVVVLFGGVPSSNGFVLSGGGPTSIGQVLRGNI